MRPVPAARARLRRLGADAHLPHQRADVPPAHAGELLPEHAADPAGAEPGQLQLHLVDPAHQREIRGGPEARRVIPRAPIDAEHLRLLGEGESVRSVDFFLRSAGRGVQINASRRDHFFCAVTNFRGRESS